MPAAYSHRPGAFAGPDLRAFTCPRNRVNSIGVDTGKSFHVLVARGPDGQQSKPIRVDVSRQGFEKSLRQLHDLCPSLGPERTLAGLEFASHHRFTYAGFLAQHGYCVVNVLPAHTNQDTAALR